MAKYKVSGTMIKYGGDYYRDGDTIELNSVPESLKPHLKPLEAEPKPEKQNKPDKEKP